MEYFIIENGQQSGPFTIEQLAQKHITSETLVWAEGMTNWTPAWQVEQLKYILSGNPRQTPPPFNPQDKVSDTPIPPMAHQNGESAYTAGANGPLEGNGTDQTFPPTGDPTKEDAEADKKKKNRTPWLIALAVVIVALLFFIFTNPNKQDHESAIKSEITTAVEKASNENQNQESDDVFTQGFNMITKMITGTFFDTALDTLLQYHNYLLFSKTTINWGNENHTVSFGILGKVHTINEDDILKALNNLNPTKMEVQTQNPDQPLDNSADQQQTNQDNNATEKVDKSADQIASQISNKVQKGLEQKIDKEINQVADSTTIDRLVNRIMSLFGIN
ncbi:MAG: GYF domain-containing protein [Prevotella sp.]|jgi:hypothetical protein|nr:GYF domain-containing protein [Prevotella sp.]